MELATKLLFDAVVHLTKSQCRREFESVRDT